MNKTIREILNETISHCVYLDKQVVMNKSAIIKKKMESIGQAEAELKALMDEEELANCIYGLRCCEEHQGDIDFEDCKDMAKAIKQWWEGK